MPLLLSLVGWKTLVKAGAALLVLALLALLFAFACVLAWLYTWEDTLYQLGWAGPGPVMQGVLQLETDGLASLASAPGQLLAGPGGGLVPLGNFTWGSGSNTFCELYVEQQTGMGNQGASAAAAASRMQSLGLLQPGLALHRRRRRLLRPERRQRVLRARRHLSRGRPLPLDYHLRPGRRPPRGLASAVPGIRGSHPHSV